MAEARNAIDLYYLQKQGFHITGVEDGYFTLSVSIPYPSTFLQTIHASIKDSMKAIRNRLWPATLTQVFVVMGAVSSVAVRAPKSSWYRSGKLAHWLWAIDEILNKWNPIHSSLAIEFRVWYLASMAAFVGMIGIMTFERFLLRYLLGFKSWLYVKPKTKVPIRVKIWGGLVKIFSGSADLTNSFSPSLPSLPLPSLNHTISCYLDSVKPLLSEQEYAETKKLAKEFQQGEGKKFQWYLWFRKLITRNYVADWWEKYVYLRGRTPLAVNSNYYITDSISRPTTDPIERAACVAHHFLIFKDKIENETLKPMRIRNMVPLCMDQYTRMFGTSRVPGREFDRIIHNDNSRHIVVLYKGEYFKINVYHGARGTQLIPYTTDEIKVQLQEIVSFVDKLRDPNSTLVDKDILPKSRSTSKLSAYSRIQSFSDLNLLREEEKEDSSPLVKYEGSGIAALTAGPRSNWAEVREVYFSAGLNRRSLRDIESAAFLIVLEDKAYSTLTERGRQLFTGDGFNRFFDKSLTLVTFKDGYVGLNTEHSWADAPVVAHLWEYALLEELRDYQESVIIKKDTLPRNPDIGSVIDFKQLEVLDNVRQRTESELTTTNSKPVRLIFEVNEQLERAVEQAGVYAQTLVKDVDLEILKFDNFGASFMKKNGVSPDAFLQMALQLAYYRQHGQFDLTYESSMTRLFRYGRTETIRALSTLSSNWVLEMTKNSSIFPSGEGTLDSINEEPMESSKDIASIKKELIDQLREAAANHTILTKDSMVGKGIDRHLFALYITSRGFDVDSKFLNEALSVPWRLSTSQQPQKQTELRKSLHPEIAKCFMSPGGGFGPVADDGYGVSYMVVGGDHVFFHVSSKFSSERTSSSKFVQSIKRALFDMEILFS